jgi:hypothetical protein
LNHEASSVSTFGVDVVDDSSVAALASDQGAVLSVRPERLLMALMYGLAVRCKRFSQVVRSGLASIYPAFD